MQVAGVCAETLAHTYIYMIHVIECIKCIYHMIEYCAERLHTHTNTNTHKHKHKHTHTHMIECIKYNHYDC